MRKIWIEEQTGYAKKIAATEWLHRMNNHTCPNCGCFVPILYPQKVELRAEKDVYIYTCSACHGRRV